MTVWDMKTGGRPLCGAAAVLRGHRAAVTGLDLATHQDVQRLASASLDGTIRLWEAAKRVSQPPPNDGQG